MVPLAAILGAIAASLVCAAGYAIFGKPHSTKAKKRQSQIASGFVLAGGVLLGMFLVGCLVVGIGVAFFGMESSRIHSKPLAISMAVASFSAIALFIQRWAKYFAGWMAWSVLNALMMASSGHMLNNPLVPVSRSVSLVIACLMAVTVSTTVRFTKSYKLNSVDKVALLLWTLTFAIGANTEPYMLAAISLGCVGLVFAWMYNRKRRAHAKRA